MAPDKAHGVRILKAGLLRFYGEGFAAWSRSKVEAILQPGLSLQDADLLVVLKEWQDRGFVQLDWNADPLLTVMPAFVEWAASGYPERIPQR
jgi:hypothetical protein